MKSNRFWIGVIAGILLLTGLTAPLFGNSAKPVYAIITHGGETVQTIDLQGIHEQSLTQPYTFTIEGDNGGQLTLEVDHSDIRIIHADCPDGVCIDRGWLGDGTTPIVCLPNRIVITASESAGDFDAVVS